MKFAEIWRKPQALFLGTIKFFERIKNGYIENGHAALGENVINNERVTAES